MTLTLPRPGSTYDVQNEAQTRALITASDAQNLKARNFTFANLKEKPSSIAGYGIMGVVDGSEAGAGEIGEFKTATSAAVSLTTAVPADLTSLSLPAGDWAVDCNVYFSGSVGGSNFLCWVHDVSATEPTRPTNGHGIIGLGTATMIEIGPNPRRFLLSSTTTIYCGARVTFASGTFTATGIINARRMR